MPSLIGLLLAAQATFAVDTLRPPDGPVVLWHRHASPVVALRMTVPLPPDLPPGTAELLQELARPGLQTATAGIGAAFELRVDGDRATIALTGPADAFDALVAALRDATAEPDLSLAALRTARARAEDRVLASLEQPQPRLAALARARLAGLRPAGPAVDSITPETLRGLAARLFAPTLLAITMVGDVPDEVAWSAFAAWPAPVAPPGSPLFATAPPLPRPQAHHAWAALAYQSDADPVTLLVAARLVQRRIDAAGILGGAAEVWTHDRPVLLVRGGAARNDPDVAGAALITAFPSEPGDDDVSALARFLRRMVAEAAALASPAAVADAARGLRADLLLAARTPAGRAAVLDRWSAAGASVHDVLARLGDVRLAGVRDVLDGALRATPITVEVRP